MNVLLVLVDQLVPFLTGPYGDPVVRTSALDRLAAEGIRFDAAYTPYPLCSPARAALMAGVHASTLRCWDNASVFHADEPTIAHHLTLAGYETVLSGKMHFVGPDQLHGFRRRLTTDVYPASMDWVPMQDEDGRFVRGGHAKLYVPPRVGVAPWTKFFAFDEETHFRSLEFLRGREGDEPFFLVASYHHPHDPFVVTPELWSLYEHADVPTPERRAPNYTAMDVWANEAHETGAVPALDDPDAMRALRRAYYGLVTYVDRKLGELVQALEETGRLDDTAIVFTSDHGDMLGERRMVQKRTFYEWSVRVPLIVRLPGGERAGDTVSAPVSLLDLAPTFLDLAGVPDDERLPLDGVNLLDAPEDRVVFSEYHVEKVRAPCFMARRGRYKLVHVHGHDERLFDVVADPGEWEDLLGRSDLADVERELRDAIHARFDVERLAEEGPASVRPRELIARAMARNGTRWDYQPFFDARELYVR